MPLSPASERRESTEPVLNSRPSMGRSSTTDICIALSVDLSAESEASCVICSISVSMLSLLYLFRFSAPPFCSMLATPGTSLSCTPTSAMS